MTRSAQPPRPRCGARWPLAAALLAAGCAASTTVGPQWSDPQFAGRSLRGARLLVVCEAPDPALRRQCQDRVAAELVAYGATPVVVGELPAGAPVDVLRLG